MINLTTSVHDRATPVVLTISAHANPAALKRIVGESAVRIFVRHLRAVDRAKPNAIGGKRTHFYADAARQTSYAEISDGVVVSINKLGLRQRVVGGTIRKKSKWLTIPAHPDAHGKRASQFGKLEVIFNHEGRPVALARPGRARGGRHAVLSARPPEHLANNGALAHAGGACHHNQPTAAIA